MTLSNTAGCEVELHPAIQALDEQLAGLVSEIDILDAVSPLNYRDERARFFDQHYSVEPEFAYRGHTIDPFLLKRALFNLPVDKCQDEDLVALYTQIVDSYVDKIDQYKSIGTPEFLYDSLRYYGEPSEKDIRNANFILHLPERDEGDEEVWLDTQGITGLMESFAQNEGYQYTLKLDDSMIANALVSGTTVKINSAAVVSEMDAKALAHHELGVHLVTTLNARSQPLKILSLGCPVNTCTQEGLAILSEYLAGCMTVRRLKTLALRVLAVQSMIQDKSFRTTFLLLKEQYQVKDEQAFTITARVYRGGGFTKDYLYLQGFHQMLNAYEHEPDFQHLLAGKTSLECLPMISNLIRKGMLKAPEKITPAYRAPVENDAIRRFIAHAIK